MNLYHNQYIPISKRGNKIKYKIRHPHQDKWKDVEVDGKSQIDALQADQQQADQPQEELTEDNLGELEDISINEPVIEPISAESLKRTYRDAFTGQL